MGLLSSLKSIFSGGSENSENSGAMPVEHYLDYEIIPMPEKEGGQYRLNGIIRKGDKEHRIIRADLFTNKEDCAKEVVRKSTLLIDQMGDKLFG
ncbi:HlyU family transcriptional regulator [Leucothrix pacifica]|uniref:Uncharacterized protein n=1 Tax=Leucothrix pacifica TaxID=1247513 RepID=A0A317C9D6_9GAMM|nr:HlyU family transcriptional regulator [Leucothrix pacifica]PWQ92672.1 hypothetical protein DKW60_19725 [Leucothrix pacifica]